MIPPAFHRSELLVGRAAMESLAATRVILFGLGGVGGWCAEGLVRSGVGHLTLVDSDGVCVTNINRQVQALPATVGRPKVDELAARLRAIHPAVSIDARRELFHEATAPSFDLAGHDYVLDAIDSLSPKLGLIVRSLTLGCRLFSSLGASAKLDPSQVRVGSIWETTHCPLARRIRRRLRHHGVTRDFQVVYSDELLANRGDGAACGTPSCHCPRRLVVDGADGGEAHEWCSQKAFINGSMVPVTATFGMCLASLVLRDVAARADGRPGAFPAEPSRTVLLRAHDGDEVDAVAGGEAAEPGDDGA